MAKGEEDQINCYPLIERELRVLTGRHNGGLSVKLWSAGAATAAAFGVLFFWSSVRPTPGFGRPFLQVVAAGGYVAALLAGTLLTADAISREQREGTLDLLVLTDLRVDDVVLGKLAGKMILPVYGFLAAVPMLEISVLVGGTSAGECGRLLLAWINALFFSLAMSLAASAMCLEQRHAYASSVLLMLFFAVGIPLAGASLASGAPILASWLPLILSPTGPYLFASAYPFGETAFLAALLGNVLIATAFLAFTRHWLMRCQEQRVVKLKPTGRTADLCPVGTMTRTERYRQLLDRAPVEWLALYKSGTVWLLWAWTLGATGVVVLCDVAPFGTARAKLGLGVLVAMHLVLRLILALDAVHTFGADRRTGALETLLGAPLNPSEVAAGMVRHARRRYWAPVFLLSALTFWAGLKLLATGTPNPGVILLLAALLVPLDSHGLIWVGLFQGLAARNAAAALGLTLLQLVFMPWIWLVATRGIFWRSSAPELLLIWTLFILANQWWFLHAAKKQFGRYFRTLALKPFGGKNPRMESEWSPINWEEDADPEPTLT